MLNVPPTLPSTQLLTYELFLAALAHVASKLKGPEVPYLSEGVREYLIKYLGKAERVASSSGGARKGGSFGRTSVASTAGPTTLKSGDGGGTAGGAAGGGSRKASGRGARPPSSSKSPKSPSATSKEGPKDISSSTVSAPFSFPQL